MSGVLGRVGLLDPAARAAVALALQHAAELLDPALARARQDSEQLCAEYAGQLDEIAVLITGTADQTDVPALVRQLLRDRELLTRRVIELEADL